jgi:predicted SAM-dependent methyltransferase
MTLAIFCKRICGYSLWCTDVDDTYICPSLIEKYGINFARNNIELDPFPWKRKFDTVLLTEVLEHLDFNPVLAFSRIRDLLSDHGRLYVSTPDSKQGGKIARPYKTWTEIPSHGPCSKTPHEHTYLYSEDEIRELAMRTGFSVSRLDYSPGRGSRHINAMLEKKKGLASVPKPPN